MQLAEAAAAMLGTDEIMVIGGEQIFELFEEEVQKVYLTEVDAQVHGDAYFKHDFADWEELTRKVHLKQGTADQYDYTLVVYQRRPVRRSRSFRASETAEVGG